MNTNVYPNLRAHTEFFDTLSTLNRYDKLTGKQAENGTFKWQKNETGWMQGSARAIVNGYENTKRATISTFNNMVTTYMKKNQDQPLLDSNSSSIVIKAPLPNFLGDAAVVSRGIKKEEKVISSKLDACAAFIENTSDANQLGELKKDLEFVRLGLKADRTGVANLTKTYEYEENSLKQIIKRKKEKYVVAVEKLNTVSGKIDTDLEKINHLLDAIEAKIIGLEQPESIIINSGNSIEVMTKKPEDFPSTVDEAPNNLPVAISQFLANHFHRIQSDNRQIYCNAQGELSLQGDMGATDKTDVHNFLHMVTLTYGSEMRNLVVNILATDSWEPLTINHVKLTLALIAVLTEPANASRLTGKENCFAILTPQEREKVAADPKKNTVFIEFALTNLIDNEGTIRNTRELFPKQYEEALAIANSPKALEIRDTLIKRLMAEEQKAKAARK